MHFLHRETYSFGMLAVSNLIVKMCHFVEQCTIFLGVIQEKEHPVEGVLIIKIIYTPIFFINSSGSRML